MEVTISKLTNLPLAHKAMQSTVNRKITPKARLFDIYGWNHSITRTQFFSIEMKDVPTSSSIHFVRHHVGVDHFVMSNRPDRDGDEKAGRHSPVNHTMILNAESLINIMKKRLCFKASKETKELAMIIREKMKSIDEALWQHMLPQCFHQGMICKEPKPCGHYPVLKWKNYIWTLPEVV